MRTYPSALMIATVLVTLTLSGCVAPVPPSAIDDANMTNQIKTALMNEAVFKVNQIRVETINGVVTLTGVVQSRIEALHAAEMAKTIQGVREIRNGLEVQIQSHRSETQTSTVSTHFSENDVFVTAFFAMF